MSTTAALALFWIGTWVPAVLRAFALQNEPSAGWQPGDYVALAGVASSFVLGLIVALRRRDTDRDHHHDEELAELLLRLVEETNVRKAAQPADAP